MMGTQSRVPVFAYRRPADLRKGFEGLSALVREALAQDPLSGALYLFTNRRRTTAKVLHFDGTGLGLYIKRLARGRFASLWDDSAVSLSLTRSELDLFLQELLNRLADDLADDGTLAQPLVDQLAVAETLLDAELVRTQLSARAVELGLPATIPDLRRALDQDHDGIANNVDNCPHHANPDQSDEDVDSIGDPCDACLQSPGDGDDDGIQDKCDSCPAVANPDQSLDAPDYDDPDQDGIGNACGACQLSSKTGADPGENCCDPREADCTRSTSVGHRQTEGEIMRA